MRRLVPILAVLYPVSLLGLIVALRFVGERFWATSVALYLPRLAFALPLPFLAYALFRLQLRRLLWTQVVALILLPLLMGFTLSFAKQPEGAPTLRVLSFNITYCDFGTERVAQAISERHADIVLLQEAGGQPDLKAALASTYPVVTEHEEFVLASRFPLLDVEVPNPIRWYRSRHSPRFVRYVLDTPLGELAVYNVHPISPRGAVIAVRQRSRWRSVFSALRLFGRAAHAVEGNSEFRELQLATVSKRVRAETLPFIVAGDTNSPELSPALAATFGEYRDGFREAGFGFGYTFPAALPWLRLDRIFSSHELKFSSFEVGCDKASDHLCVVAELYRLPPEKAP